MPKYTVSLSKKAAKQLDKLSDNIAEPIIGAISNLANDPRPSGCKKLKEGMVTASGLEITG